MGTNFYLRRKLTIKENRKILDFINSKYMEFTNQVVNNIYNIESFLDTFTREVTNETKEYIKEIHIGKRSYGWQFLWDYHSSKYYKANLKDIKKFLANPDYEIVDEYGRVYTLTQFFDEEVGESLYKGKNGLEEGPNSYFFISDGLRFSIYEDFS